MSSTTPPPHRLLAPANPARNARAKVRELFAIDLRSLALFRIGLGLLLLVDLAGRSTDLTAHYTDAGVLPRAAMPEMHFWSSLHLLNGSAWFQALLFLAAGFFAVLLLLGYRTGLATFCSWALLGSLHVRNPLVIYGADAFLRLLLFWGMFLPLGARYSLDGRRSPLSRLRPASITTAATAGLLLQICFVYWFGVAFKSDPAWWHDGTAVGYALSVDHHATSVGRSLLAYPELLKVLTFATLALEVLGPALAFSPIFSGPTRTAVVLTFLLFHAGLGLCLELGLFSYVSGVAWLVFIPGWLWDKLPGPFRQPAGEVEEVGAGPGDLRPSRAANVLAACCLAYVFLWNVKAVAEREAGKFVPRALTAVGYALGLNQEWKMFGYNLSHHGWIVIEGKVKNKKRVDARKGDGPVSWTRPPLDSGIYRNMRWRSLDWALVDDRFKKYREYFAEYLCREWNAHHPVSDRLTSVAIYMMTVTTLPNYEITTPRKVLLVEIRCQD
jgi:hypothetical protein